MPKGTLKELLWEATMRINELERNTLPMGDIPQGWQFEILAVRRDGFRCHLLDNRISDKRPAHRMLYSDGPTPRAAMLSAIEATKREGK
jgi:hypothetical protein